MAKNSKENKGLEIQLSGDYLQAVKDYAEENQTKWADRVELISPRYGLDDGKFPLPWFLMSEEDKDWIYEFLKDHKETGIRAQMTGLRRAEKDPLNTPVPNLKVLEAAIRGWLAQDEIDGWVYCQEGDDVLPKLVTSVMYHPATGSGDNYSPASVSMHALYYSMKSDCSGRTDQSTYWHWHGEDLGKEVKLVNLMAEKGIFHETKEMKAKYDEEQKDFDEKRGEIHKQFWGHGLREQGADDWRWSRQAKSEKIKEETPKRHKMVNEEDLVSSASVSVHAAYDGEKRHAPFRTQIRVFDLETHDKGWVYAKNLTPYKYNPKLKDKIILPDLHRDLIDVLTTEMDVIMDDFIEGKSGGTTILCTGGPGLGKTLTAEIYSEIVQKPLYRVHSGQLGVGHSSVEKNLKDVLQRGSRWGACVLIDEADVYIRKRGDDLDHNAVVAAFLRTLEYFSGLLFMTTNRTNDVDDAIQSRCIATITYKPLEGDDSAKLWGLILQQFEVEVEEDTIKRLVTEFPAIPGRDMKELSKLVAKFTKGRGKFVADYDDFRKLAQFRGLV